LARIYAGILEKDEVLGTAVIKEFEKYIRERGLGKKEKYQTLGEYMNFRYIEFAAE